MISSVRSRLQLVRFAFSAILLIAATVTATAPTPGHFGPTDAVTIAGLQRHLRFIASDALEGRDALSPGFRAAAEYVAASLDRIGATPAGDGGSFFQHVGIRRTRVDAQHASVTLGDTEFKYGEDFLVPTPGEATGPMTFVGQGYRVASRHLDPFASLDVHNQVLVVAQPAPDVGALTRGTDYTTPADNARALGATAVLTVASFQRLAAWTKMREAEARGSLDIDRLAEKNPIVPGIIAGPRLAAVLFRGEREDASKIVSRGASGDAYAPFALRATKTIRIHAPAAVNLEDTENVIAVIEGSDPVLKHEFVALGAHLDHIGKDDHPVTTKSGARAPDVIYNGADDDGSGVVALLEMAEAVAAAPRPKRSLLFVWHTGEEYGSWGARYFNAFPTVPLDRIVAQLNVDMIGRSRADGDKAPEDAVLTGPNEVYIVGSRRLSQELGDICDRVDRAFLNLALNYKYDAPDDPERIYERSDHYEYAQKGIPVAFFFTGLHADYHHVTDEIERIDFEKLQKVTRTVLATAWTLANAPDRPHLDHGATR